MQKHRLPSLFWTSTTALHHGLWLGQIALESNSSCGCVWISSTSSGIIHLNHSLNGASSVTLITCSVEWVQPSSRVLRRKCYGIQSGANGQNLLALVTKIPICSNLTSLTAFSASALWSAAMSGCLGPHPAHLFCQAMSVAQAFSWQPPLLPLGSSSSGSEGTSYCFSPQWQYSYWHCTFLCNSNILAPISHFCVGILYHQTLGQQPSPANRVWVITLNLTPVNAIFICVYIIFDEKVSIVLQSLVVTTSSYLVGSSTFVATLLLSNMVVTQHTTRR